MVLRQNGHRVIAHFSIEPNSITFKPSVGSDGADQGEIDGDWVDELCFLVSGGDITRRDWILWNITVGEAGNGQAHLEATL